MFDNRALKRLIVPLLIEQALIVLVGMAVVMMLATAGEAAVSGVSLVDMVDGLMLNLFIALTTGGAVVAAQYIGQRDLKSAGEAANQLITITLLISFCVATLMLVFKKSLLQMLFGNVAQDVMRNALSYLTITALSYPFLALYHACAALFRSMGNSTLPMRVSLGMNGLIVAGGAVFLFVFHMGVQGMALSMLLFRALAALVLMCLLQDNSRSIHVNVHRLFRLNAPMIRRILHFGVPNGLENGIFQLGRVLVVGIIASFGTVQIAANAVANNLDSLGCIPGMAMQMAVITVVGQSVGAGDYAQVEAYIKKLMKITYAMAVVWNGLILAALPWLLNLYSLSKETLDLAYILVFIHDGIAMLLWPTSFVLPYTLRAANDVYFAMGVSILSMILFRIVFSYLLGSSLSMGAVGVWIAMIMDWTIRSIFYVGRLHRGKWKLKRI